MHIISKRILRDFCQRHPRAEPPLLAWHTLLQHCHARSFSELKTTFGSADWVGGYVVFDIGGNKYRVIADVIFRTQRVYIKHVLTHQEYDQWTP